MIGVTVLAGGRTYAPPLLIKPLGEPQKRLDGVDFGDVDTVDVAGETAWTDSALGINKEETTAWLTIFNRQALISGRRFNSAQVGIRTPDSHPIFYLAPPQSGQIVAELWNLLGENSVGRIKLRPVIAA